MAWDGRGSTIEGEITCSICGKQKKGTKKINVGGIGFGAVEKIEWVNVCINPDCQEGKNNMTVGAKAP